jgi:hypothetical protein
MTSASDVRPAGELWIYTQKIEARRISFQSLPRRGKHHATEGSTSLATANITCRLRHTSLWVDRNDKPKIKTDALAEHPFS